MVTLLSLTALGAIVWGAIAALVGLAVPAFWLWMLIDAILRDDADFTTPSGPNAKLIWVLLIAFVQVAALLYFFLVWLEARKRIAPVSA